MSKKIVLLSFALTCLAALCALNAATLDDVPWIGDGRPERNGADWYDEDPAPEFMAMPCGKDYPAQLEALLGSGYKVYNSGDGGENSITIPARQGAVPLVTSAPIAFTQIYADVPFRERTR